MTVFDLLNNAKDFINNEIVVKGWVRNNRDQKQFGFISFNDGTKFEGIQIVYEADKINNYDEVSKIRVGSSIEVKGVLVESPGKQPYEIKAISIKLLGDSPEDYPIQPKRHTREFLREVAHLRARTNLFQAVFRVRSEAAFAIHSFFNERNFVYVHTPIITANDGEGAGEMFRVTTLKENETDYSKDFFGKKVNLTVTGQLEGETYAMAFNKIYTFGPTFRAENSNTQKHASEFWMIEPEIAFADINDIINLSWDMLVYVINHILTKLPTEIEFFDSFVEKGLKSRLEKIIESNYTVITHEEAVNILLKVNDKFSIKAEVGHDLATEHEKYLTEVHFKGPVYVINWPKEIKAFYMKLNDDNKTVAAMDLLVPGSGELIGGSQREEDYTKLTNRMDELGVPKEDLYWYLDTRKYGGCVHAGFGLGFERLIMYLTGVENIRDVIPYPRTPKNCDF